MNLLRTQMDNMDHPCRATDCGEIIGEHDEVGRWHILGVQTLTPKFSLS